MMKIKKNYLPLLLVLVLVGCSVVGCSTNVPVQGKVVFNDDKSPLTVGVLVFDNGVENGNAKIESDGSFVVGFGKSGNGIPAGTYRVAIAGAEEPLPRPDNMTEEQYNAMYLKPVKRLVDPKYDNIETSGLTVEITKSTREIEIGVDRPSKSHKK